MKFLLALVMVSGCSVLTVRDARTTPTKAIVCKSSWISPAIDTAIALTGAALIAWYVTEPDTGESDGHTMTNREAAVYPGVALALPFGLSAAYGFGKVSTCKRAERPAPAFAEK